MHASFYPCTRGGMVDLLYGLAGSEAYYSFYFIKLFIYLLFVCVYATEDKT